MNAMAASVTDPRAALAGDADAARRLRLAAALIGHGHVAIAVSGGVDSLTLAVFAQRLVDEGKLRARFCFAQSPAVPKDAAARVFAVAKDHGFDVDVFDAGEFADAAYTQNPANRCYFCKGHLFDAMGAHLDAIRAVAGENVVVCTGANVDDLSDHRPGRVAAAERNVAEPFVAAGYQKDDVRALARFLGLADVAELPASPCLSSRVETGIPIDAATLALVDDVERAVRAAGLSGSVRCRVRASGLVIEHDAAIADGERAAFVDVVRAVVGDRAFAFAPYKRGSAFLRVLDEGAR